MRFLLPGIIILLFISCKTETGEFTPGEIWPDNNGVHINAHGGGILLFIGVNASQTQKNYPHTNTSLKRGGGKVVA